MSQSTQDKMSDIQAMLESGHKSVRLEKHTLIIWGLAIAGVILLAQVLIPLLIGVVGRTWISVIVNGLIIILVAGAALIDYFLTRRIRHRRSETVSFVQSRLTRVFWLLASMVIILSIMFDMHGTISEMHFFIYPIAIAAIGVAIYTYGLFSQQRLLYAGWLLLLSAFMGGFLAATDIWQFVDLENHAILVFGLGLPILAFFIDYKTKKSQAALGILAASWLVITTLPVVINIYKTHLFDQPKGEQISLSRYQTSSKQQLKGDRVLVLKKGTSIPVKLGMFGNVVEKSSSQEFSFNLSQPIHVSLTDGIADGRVKVGSGIWEMKERRGGALRARLFTTQLTKEKEPLSRIVLQVMYW